LYPTALNTILVKHVSILIPPLLQRRMNGKSRSKTQDNVILYALNNINIFSPATKGRMQPETKGRMQPETKGRMQPETKVFKS